MNILIVGNGFDLSHYLPTKYDHFMVAMEAILNSDEFVDYLDFDQIYGALYKTEKSFFGYTKSIYKTETIKIGNLNDIREKLKSNVWFNYFREHKSKIETWIDFEKSIGEALTYLSILISSYENKKGQVTLIHNCVYERKVENVEHLVFPNYISKKLETLQVLEGYDGFYSDISVSSNNSWQVYRNYIIGNDDEFDEGEEILELKALDILNNLYTQLDELSSLFTFYLKNIVRKLKPKKKFKKLNITSDVEIFSFNYTNTISDIYFLDNKISFLHGSLDNDNIVLGVEDIPEGLNKYQTYDFTKYAQKIIKGTDYKFLDESIILNSIFENYKYEHSEYDCIDPEEIIIDIWGHSLDVSDGDYIKELFVLDSNPFIKPTINIYHHSDQAKKQILFNLYSVLGHVIVNKWLKKERLNFVPNPNLVRLNKFIPAKLPLLDLD